MRLSSAVAENHLTRKNVMAKGAPNSTMPAAAAVSDSKVSVLVFPSFSGRDGALDHGELWQAGCRPGEADAPEVTRASSLRVIG